MTDTELDRILDTALGVDPSPGFLSHVRDRVATEPMRTPQHTALHDIGARGVAALGAAAGAVFVVALLLWPNVTDAPPGADMQLAETTLAGAGEPAEVPADPEQGLEAPGKKEDPMPAEAAASRVSAAAPASVEVVFEPAEVAALRKLFADASQGLLAPSSLPDLVATSGPLEPIDAIDVAPIAIDPLRPIEAEPGVM